MPKLDDILKQREAQYGSYSKKATEIQVMKDIVRNSKNWNDMPPFMQESIDMIISKLGRVLNGDISHVDNFTDIAGYAQLVCEELNKKPEEEDLDSAVFIFDENTKPEDVDAAVDAFLRAGL